MTEPSPAVLLTHEFFRIPLHKIHRSPHQMRRRFDDESIEELAQSLKEKGMLQPIAVRSMGSAFELIAGERRLRAATLLNWETIPAMVLAQSNDEDSAILGLIENLQRVNLDPLEEARGYKQLSDPPYNMTQEAIAAKVGRQKSSICRALALLQLPREIQHLLPRGNISEAHTRSLRLITDRAEQIAMATLVDKNGWSVRETERRVNEAVGRPTWTAKRPAPSSDESPFRLSWKGSSLNVQWTFNPKKSALRQTLNRLESAITAFLKDAAPAKKIRAR